MGFPAVLRGLVPPLEHKVALVSELLVRIDREDGSELTLDEWGEVHEASEWLHEVAYIAHRLQSSLDYCYRLNEEKARLWGGGRDCHA